MKSYKKLPMASLVRQSLPRETFELSFEQVERLKNFSDVVLGILSVAGILTMTVLAPNALQALKLFEKRKKKKFSSKQRQRKIVKSFYYLRSSGMIEFRRKNDDDYEVILTDKGLKNIRRMNLETLSIARPPQKWDGSFWQVAADIPTKKYRQGADAFRSKLKEMGFFGLQRTLWFYPYDPRIEIEFITCHYGIDSFVTVMKIAELDKSDERVLRYFFKKQGTI